MIYFFGRLAGFPEVTVAVLVDLKRAAGKSTVVVVVGWAGALPSEVSALSMLCGEAAD